MRGRRDSGLPTAIRRLGAATTRGRLLEQPEARDGTEKRAFHVLRKPAILFAPDKALAVGVLGPHYTNWRFAVMRTRGRLGTVLAPDRQTDNY